MYLDFISLLIKLILCQKQLRKKPLNQTPKVRMLKEDKKDIKEILNVEENVMKLKLLKKRKDNKH